MTTRSASITDVQRKALAEVVRREPSRWKLKMRKIWERGGADATGPDAELIATLYSLRNTHGPSWLTRVRVSKTGEVQSWAHGDSENITDDLLCAIARARGNA